MLYEHVEILAIVLFGSISWEFNLIFLISTSLYEEVEIRGIREIRDSTGRSGAFN